MATLSFPSIANPANKDYWWLQPEPAKTGFYRKTKEDVPSALDFSPKAREMFDPYGADFGVQPLEVPQFDYPELPSYIEPLGETLQSFMQSRISPDFSLFGPEDRAAADRRIGAEVAKLKGETASRLAAQGITGGGMPEQLYNQAAIRGAFGLADLTASFAEKDEEARRRAAASLEQMRQYGVETWKDMWKTAMGGAPGFAAQVAGPELGGPIFEQLDFYALSALGLTKEQFDSALAELRKQGDFQPQDLLRLLTTPGVGGFLLSAIQNVF